MEFIVFVLFINGFGHIPLYKRTTRVPNQSVWSQHEPICKGAGSEWKDSHLLGSIRVTWIVVISCVSTTVSMVANKYFAMKSCYAKRFQLLMHPSFVQHKTMRRHRKLRSSQAPYKYQMAVLVSPSKPSAGIQPRSSTKQNNSHRSPLSLSFKESKFHPMG